MGKLTRRQRLKRDPANRPLHKLVAWVRRNGHVVEPTIHIGILMKMDRLRWRGRHRNKYTERMQTVELQP